MAARSLLAGLTLLASPAGQAQAPAEAGTLKEAADLLQQLQPQRAAAIAETRIEQGGLSRDDLVAGLRTLGLSSAALGQAGRAAAAFRQLLAIDPGHRLSGTLSPKLRAPFERARAAAAKEGVQLAVSAAIPDALAPGERLHVVGKVDHDALGMVAECQVRLAAGTTVRYAPAQPGGRGFEASLDPPEADFADVSVEFLDRHRNTAAIAPPAGPVRVRVARSAAAAAAGTPIGVEGAAPTPPLYRRWKVWAGVGAGGLAVGGISTLVGGVVYGAAIRAPSVDEAEAQMAWAQRLAVLRTLGFSVAVAAAAGAILAAAVPEAPEVAPGPGGVSVTFRF